MKKIKIFGTIGLVSVIVVISLIIINETNNLKTVDVEPEPLAYRQTMGYLGVLKTDEAVGEYDDYYVIEQDGVNYRIWMEDNTYEE